MAYKVSYVEKDDRDLIEHHLGGFNDFPPNWRKASITDIVQRSRFAHYTPEYLDYRQMFPRDTEGHRNHQKRSVHAWLMIFHDWTGIGIVQHYWEKKIEYFMFGCEHQNKELSSEECRAAGITHHGRCWHVIKCQKCGYVEAYDSSD